MSERLPSAGTILDVIVSFDWSQSKQAHPAPRDAPDAGSAPNGGHFEMNWRILSPSVPMPLNAIRRLGDKVCRSPSVKKNMFKPPQPRLQARQSGGRQKRQKRHRRLLSRLTTLRRKAEGLTARNHRFVRSGDPALGPGAQGPNQSDLGRCRAGTWRTFDCP